MYMQWFKETGINVKNVFLGSISLSVGNFFLPGAGAKGGFLIRILEKFGMREETREGGRPDESPG